VEHFYIITNQTKDPQFKVTDKVKDYLMGRGIKCTLSKEEHADISHVPQDIDLVIVLGGDGTLLRAANDLAGKNVPFLGINLGNLGFLAEVNKDDIENALSKLLEGNYEIEKRMMLAGHSYEGVSEMDCTRALNDIVITRKGSLQIIKFSISVNGQFLHRYQADGMIVATPTGSTGYNLSAGGPIVDPKAEMIVITPVCPHSMQNRSIVLSPDDEITIEVEASHKGERQEVEAIFDGNHKVTLCTGDRIIIRRSEKTTGIVKLNKVSFLERLQEKMCD